MIETKNKIRQNDLDELCQNEIFNFFKNKTVFITGATGLIGSELVLSFLCANRLKNLNAKIVASVRNIEKAKKIFECVLDNPNFDFYIQDVIEPISYSKKVDYIIHTANTTSSKEILKNPIDCAITIIEGTKNILEFAKKNKASMCYLSSLEIYGINTLKNVKENDYGILDPLNPRNSYPIGKKTAENLCCAYSIKYNVNVKIARLTQTFGAGADINDSRVCISFAKSIVQSKDIVLHTQGKTTRSYLYLTDAISAILTVLIKGKTAEAYNIANSSTLISIKDMAEFLAKKYKTNVKYIIDNKNRGYLDTIILNLDTKKLKSLGWEAKIGLDEMYEKIIKSFEDEKCYYT